MDYQKIYNSICKRGQKRTLTNTYIEKHHIIPKCLNGIDNESNLTQLTAKEHYLCHKILSEQLYPDHYGLAHALYMMCHLKSGVQERHITSARIYEQIRTRAIMLMKVEKRKNPLTGKKNGMFGRKHTPETVEKMRQAALGRNIGIKHSAETKQKIRDSWTSEKRKEAAERTRKVHTGKVLSEETKQKIRDTKVKNDSVWNKGKKGLFRHTPETIAKMKDQRKGTQQGVKNSNARRTLHVESGQIFNTRAEAAKTLSISISTLRLHMQKGIFKSI